MADAPPPFALAPALINPDEYLDYSTRDGQSLYAAATSSLPRTFDGKPACVLPFLQSVADRSVSSGWEPILHINVGGDDVDLKYLLTEYGQISMLDIIENAEEGYIGQQSRGVQSSHQLCQCLTYSITEELSQRMATKVEDYSIEGTPDGPACLKTLLEMTMVETPSTVRQLRENLMRLEEKIEDSFKSNILDFNQYVLVQLRHLAARGETTNDLLNSLLNAYLKVKDAKFHKYISAKKDDHDDGTTHLSPERIMHLAKSKFESLEQEGEWLVPDAAQQQIIAMTAELGKLQKDLKQAKETLGKRTKDPKKTNKDAGKWAWKDEPPKSAEPKTKVVSNFVK